MGVLSILFRNIYFQIFIFFLLFLIIMFCIIKCICLNNFIEKEKKKNKISTNIDE